jgi:hypothetical protein
MTILGFTGAAGAGKDTCANIASYMLQLEHGKKCATIACADPIKRMCRDILGVAYDVPAKSFYGSQANKLEALTQINSNRGRPWSGRQIMQFIGTDCFQQVAPDIWARYAVNTAKELLATQFDVVLISDVRFKLEAQAIKEAGGYVVRVDRPKVDNRDDHISEQEYKQLQIDAVIRNESDSLDDLERLVRDTLKVLGIAV